MFFLGIKTRKIALNKMSKNCCICMCRTKNIEIKGMNKEKVVIVNKKDNF